MSDAPAYLCPEGQRLWDEWDELREKVEQPWLPDDKSASLITEANAAWTAYQDHRAACGECGKERTE